MKLKICNLLLCFFLLAKVNGQISFGLHGSYSISAIFSDGIVVATDSRINLYEKKNDVQIPLVYFDVAVKTVIVGNFVVSYVGHANAGSLFLNKLIDIYTTEYLKEIPVARTFLDSFFFFCKIRLPKKVYDTILSNHFTVAGYENNNPILVVHSNHLDTVVSYGLIESGRSDFRLTYNGSSSYKDYIGYIESSIYKYATDHRKEYTIGGPIRIVLVKATGVKWLKNEPSRNYDTMTEAIADIKAGKIKVHYTSAEAEIKSRKLWAIGGN